ncbi:hypothetical protein GTA62_14790 [Roseobacter sp. HKCCD9010]|uniref:hypothetical protein n=1 Tax=unclassified Roseobacter TaxID=196798 RepID=UPI0014927E0C|nr:MULTISPECIES: hypothetical protein [unclassified Roseobacter]MBF9050622.1 hypothetical protein [Rhodobacterales bacterium HKCCD4356]NNV11960.1 hypothetical protein [Roseobacter sp. HKCCD7357]NNV16973.1 hypothetical protein [Roseobacter sp. HKCCD8768]NNV26202.1 hypothetical protein [Roseobacter sp. HKCCD8192]NNV30697.1 hypothetical protein [Roseobacter sp. HKCCD9061]
MKIITPITVTDEKLLSSNIPENDHAEWDNGTAYARGDFVISTSTHTVYRSLTSSNQGNDPDLEMTALADPLIDDPDPVNWQIISATNRWKMFDQKPSVQATMTDEIALEVAPGEFVGGIAGFGVMGTAVSVEVYIPGSPDEVVFQRTIDLYAAASVANWYDYYFADLAPLTEFIITDLPPYANGVVKVTVTNTGGIAAIGQLAVGPVSEIGEVVTPGTGLSGLDFSFVQNDEFGNLTRTVREATRLADLEVVVPTASVLVTFEKLRALRGGAPAVWVGDDRAALAANVYGFARDYRLVYQAGPNSILSIQVQGMV